MRIHLNLSHSQIVIPFNYQEILTSIIHKWIGHDNPYHGQQNQYSFSWIQNTVATKGGVKLKPNAYFFISSRNEDLIKKIMKGILSNPVLYKDIRVTDVNLIPVPEFKNKHSFIMGSPVLLRVKSDGVSRVVTVEDASFESDLTNSFKNNLKKAGIDTHGLSIMIDPDSSYQSTKLVTYKNIKNKTSLVPILIKGTKEQLQFAWCNGIGHSTGIGFGALK